MKSSKIKVLHIIPEFTTGGAERLVLHYAHLLDKNKFVVAVASTVEDGTLRRLFEQHRVQLFIGSRTKDGGRLGVTKKLKKFIEEYRPDIIHTHLFGADLFGWYFKVCKRLPVQWISTQHNVEFATSWMRRFVWKHILKRADKVIAVADKVKAYSVTHFGLKNEQVHVLKNGIGVDALSDISQTIGERKPWQLGIVGRLQKQKGHIYLINALSKIDQYEWHLHVYGDGSEKEQLQQYAREKGIDTHITWHGVVSDVAQVYGSVDIVIQPSLWEGLSLVVMEALCAGRLVIASIPAGEELIEDKRTGLLVRVAHVDDIVDALHYSFAHIAEIQSIARDGRVYGLKHFDIHLNVLSIEQVYTSLVKN